MSKILKNTTGSPVTVTDTGITIAASSQYTIPPQDYLLWAASSNVITYIGSGTLIVNDGSFDLSISDGIDLIKGIFPTELTVTGISNTVDVGLPKTAFGELSIAQLSPYINLKAVKGLSERLIETYSSGTGSSAGVHDHLPGKEFEVESGTSVGGYGVLRSKKVMEYKSGVGNIARFTAKFSAPAALTTMRAGLQNIGNELAFGYNGTQFGILHRTGGRPEIRTLTLTQRATSSQTATVTLNDTAFTSAVTNSTIEQNAYEIATGNAYAGWRAYSIGSTVVFYSESVGAKNGTYSLSSTGNLAGSFSQMATGLTPTDTWIYQANWEVPLTSGNDPFILDPSKGNVYQIQYQYLGYGEIRFFVENPNTGTFISVHKIKYANTNTSPSLDLPNFKIGIIAASLGGTTNVSVSTASMACFSESMEDFPGKVHSVISTATGVGTTRNSLVSFRKVPFSDNVFNISDVKGLQFTFSSEGTNPVIVEVYLNATIAGVLRWNYIDEDVPLLISEDRSTITGGELIYAASVARSSNILIELKELDLYISDNDVLTFAVRTTSGTSSASVSFVFGES